MARQIPTQVEMKRESKKLPTEYEMTIVYKDGSKESQEVVSHSIIQSVRLNCDDGVSIDKVTGQRFKVEMAKAVYLEYVTADDEWELINWDEIRKIQFDKRWSQVVADRRKAN